MQDISKLRKSYERAELSETDSAADPFKQFEAWLQEAISAELPEPNAMTLATVGSDMRPSSRIVLIKGLDARGIVWFTNYNSRTGQQLAGNPVAWGQTNGSFGKDAKAVCMTGCAIALIPSQTPLFGRESVWRLEPWVKSWLVVLVSNFCQRAVVPNYWTSFVSGLT